MFKLLPATMYDPPTSGIDCGSGSPVVKSSIVLVIMYQLNGVVRSCPTASTFIPDIILALFSTCDTSDPIGKAMYLVSSVKTRGLYPLAS